MGDMSRIAPSGRPPFCHYPCLNSEEGTTRSEPSSEQSLITHHDNQTRPNIYENPPIVSGMQSASNSFGPSTDGSTSPARRALLSSSSAPSELHMDCEQLEKSNRRMKVIFRIMVTLCSLTITIYVAVIIAFFMKMSRMDPDQSARLSGSHDSVVGSQGQTGVSRSPSDLKNCVPEKDMDEFKKIWDPEDKKDITDILKNVGFVYNSITRQTCFTSLQWVPRIMDKINSRVQESVSYIEDQQKKINQTVNAYTSPNNTGSLCSNTGKGTPAKADPEDATSSVYAHYFIEDNAKYTADTAVRSLKWIREGQKFSSRRNVGVSSSSGNITIRLPGFYFIYTHLVFKDDDTEEVHRVVRIRDNQRTHLLESVRGAVSFLQGVFKLRKHDTLLVEATVRSVDLSRDKSSYFGIYLIRT